jgi:hypothetical protein
MYHGELSPALIPRRHHEEADMLNEMLHDAAFADRRRQVAAPHRHDEPGPPRHGFLGRWRAWRADRPTPLAAVASPVTRVLAPQREHRAEPTSDAA